MPCHGQISFVCEIWKEGGITGAIAQTSITGDEEAKCGKYKPLSFNRVINIYKELKLFPFWLKVWFPLWQGRLLIFPYFPPGLPLLTFLYPPQGGTYSVGSHLIHFQSSVYVPPLPFYPICTQTPACEVKTNKKSQSCKTYILLNIVIIILWQNIEIILTCLHCIQHRPSRQRLQCAPSKTQTMKRSRNIYIFIFICYNRTFNIFVIYDWNVSRVYDIAVID